MTALALHLWTWLRLLFDPAAVRRVSRPPADWVVLLETWLVSPEAQAVRRAVVKQETDSVLSGALGDAKLREALEWAERYAKHVGLSLPRHAWKTRLLVELVVGLQKGKLS